MRRLVCAFVFRKPLKTGFPCVEAHMQVYWFPRYDHTVIRPKILKGEKSLNSDKCHNTVTVVTILSTIYGPRREKTCLRGVANNTGADRPAHLRSLVSTFVIRFLESFICKLATGEISIFLIVSVTEETGLNLALTETPKTGFLAIRPICAIGKV